MHRCAPALPIRALACAAACLMPPPASAATGAGPVCLAAPYAEEVESAPAALLSTIRPHLDRYPSLARALEVMAPEICVDAAPSEAVGYYEAASNRIVIDAGAPRGLQIAVLVHELRHVEQFERGLCPDLTLSMREYARTRWALEADALVTSLLFAWDMAGRGEPGPWDGLSGWAQYGAVADAFASEIGRSGDPGVAAEAAFAAWYEDAERLEAYYIAACSDYLGEQEERHLLPGNAAVSPDFFDALCVLPDGTRFACGEPGGLER